MSAQDWLIDASVTAVWSSTSSTAIPHSNRFIGPEHGLNTHGAALLPLKWTAVSGDCTKARKKDCGEWGQHWDRPRMREVFAVFFYNSSCWYYRMRELWIITYFENTAHMEQAELLVLLVPHDVQYQLPRVVGIIRRCSCRFVQGDHFELCWDWCLRSERRTSSVQSVLILVQDWNLSLLSGASCLSSSLWLDLISAQDWLIDASVTAVWSSTSSTAAAFPHSRWAEPFHWAWIHGAALLPLKWTAV